MNEELEVQRFTSSSTNKVLAYGFGIFFCTSPTPPESLTHFFSLTLVRLLKGEEQKGWLQGSLNKHNEFTFTYL